MAVSLFTASNWCFKLISVYCFCLACLVSSTMSLNTKSPMRAGLVILVFLLAAFLMSYFLVWRSLVSKPMKSLAQQRKESTLHVALRLVFYVWSAVLLVFLLLTHLSIPYMIFMGKTTEVGTVPYVLFACLGTFFTLVVITVLFEVLESVLRATILRNLERSWLPCLQMRWHVTRVVVVVLIVSGMTVVSLMNGAKGPAVKQVEVPVRMLPPSMNGFRIVQFTDVHLGPTVGRTQLQQSVNVANSLNPDIVVITGDLVDSTVENLADAVTPLRHLRATHGVFFVTGNHEYYTYDVKNWEAYLKFLGVVCLPNRSVKIFRPEKPQDWFYLAGTNDLQANSAYEKKEHFNLAKALEGTDTDHAVILLAHQPKAVEHVIKSGYDVSLILSGHTHGGQMFPINVLAYFMYPYLAGLYQPSDGMYIYVSSGTWYNGPPMRLFSRAEITLITLLSS